MAPVLTPALAALVGAILSSFAVTAGLRAAGSQSALRGRSRCEGCGASLSYTQTIPLASYMLQGGRRSCCPGPIPLAHPLAEACGALAVAAAAAVLPPDRWPVAASLCALLIFISAYDIRTLRIPDWATGAAGALGLLAALQRGGVVEAALASLVFGGVLMGTAELFRRARGTIGLGGGDIKLAAALCLWTGPMTAGIALVAACLAALAWIAVLRPEGRLAFGPFLGLAFWWVGLAGGQA